MKLFGDEHRPPGGFITPNVGQRMSAKDSHHWVGQGASEASSLTYYLIIEETLMLIIQPQRLQGTKI